jgi:predicted DNA-binding transcriptional regulator AlpA
MVGIALLLNTREIEQMNGIRAWMMAVITFALVGAARSASPLKKLKPEHPRLMLTDTRLTELKQQAQTDETLQRFVREVITQADGHLDDSAFKYKEKGSLLGMSRACVDRIYTLGVAWRWTGDVKYAEKIKENLLTVCAFPAWNPDHFLDAAEMAHAVGIGYDWIYDYLDAESRERIEQALIHNALKPGIERYERKYKHFTYAYNWNQVCNGGLLMASLAHCGGRFENDSVCGGTGAGTSPDGTGVLCAGRGLGRRNWLLELCYGLYRFCAGGTGDRAGVGPRTLKGAGAEPNGLCSNVFRRPNRSLFQLCRCCRFQQTQIGAVYVLAGTHLQESGLF